MTVDQADGAKQLTGFVDQMLECGVIGGVTAGNAALRLGRRQPRPVDFRTAGNDARDDSQSRPDAGTVVARGGSQRPLEHGAVEFARLAVDIDPGAGKERRYGGSAQCRYPGYEAVNEGVLGAADRLAVETCHPEKGGIIVSAAVWRRDQDRQGPAIRVDDLKDLRPAIIVCASHWTGLD